jgi:hypothetical protein
MKHPAQKVALKMLAILTLGGMIKVSFDGEEFEEKPVLRHYKRRKSKTIQLLFTYKYLFLLNLHYKSQRLKTA